MSDPPATRPWRGHRLSWRAPNSSTPLRPLDAEAQPRPNAIKRRASGRNNIQACRHAPLLHFGRRLQLLLGSTALWRSGVNSESSKYKRRSSPGTDKRTTSLRQPAKHDVSELHTDQRREHAADNDEAAETAKESASARRCGSSDQHYPKHDPNCRREVNHGRCLKSANQLHECTWSGETDEPLRYYEEANEQSCEGHGGLKCAA